MKIKWIALPLVLTSALVLGACTTPTVEEPEVMEEPEVGEPVEGMEEGEMMEEPMEEAGEEAE
ncbi:MAG: hypothetical protein AAF716_08215 [Cyanobacteria bacterium P01_D01_bin.1]